MRTAVIAEIGSNHGRTPEMARSVIAAAAKAGAGFVKFQLFDPYRTYPPTAGRVSYFEEEIFSVFQKFQLNPKWLPSLKRYASSLGLGFLCSAFDEKSYDLVDPHVSMHKIASYEITHFPLLRHVAQKGKPILLSTGCCEESEVWGSVRVLEGAGRRPVLMQCTGSYPAPIVSLNLEVIRHWRSNGMTVGFSDHSAGTSAAPLAVAAGATIVEKHLTLDKRADGPDHRFSLEPREFSQMVQKIRNAEVLLGDGTKAVQACETELRSFCRRSVFTTCSVERGDPLEGRLIVLRNGVHAPGEAPDTIERMESGVATCALEAWTPVRAGEWE